MTHHWAQLDNLLLGRTLHLQSVTPLSSRRLISSEGLKEVDFASLSRHLHSFLRARLSGFSAEASSISEGHNARPPAAAWVRRVTASKVNLPPESDGQSDVPSPWALEVEVQGPSSPGAPKEAGRAHAHFLFLSTKKYCTPTHYPILLWKAPPAAIFNSDDNKEGAAQNGISIGSSSVDADSYLQPTSSSRLLVSHILEFIERYFDCRISQRKPMCSVRGTALERLANALVKDLRRLADDYDLSAEALALEHHPLDLGYAVPAYVHEGGEMDPDTSVVEGPAPLLNLITLTVPAAVVKGHLENTNAESGSMLISTVQDYLAKHTSLLPSNLTLVRVGIASVFIGSPTTTSLIASAQRGQTNGEVRIKLNPIEQQRLRRGARRQPSQFEAARIAGILWEIVRIAEDDDW